MTSNQSLKVFLMHFIATFFSLLAILLSSFTLYKLNKSEDTSVNFINERKELAFVLLDRAKNCILINEEIEEKESIFSLMDSLSKTGEVIEAGSDDLRIKYVSIQGSIEHVLSCKEMESSKVGATYFFKNDKNEVYVFSVKANQANNPLELSEHGLWFGKIENTSINARITEILDYLSANGGPNLLIELDSTGNS